MSDKTAVLAKSGYHHGDLRAQLVEATRELVEAHGPEGFSVSEACRRAGVSSAAPYRHFRDKHQMLIAVCIEGFARMRARMIAEAAECPDDPVARIIRIGQTYVEFAVDEPGVFRMMFSDTGHDPDGRCREAGEAAYAVLLQEVARYFGKADIDEEVLRRAFPLWTFVHGAAFLMIDKKMDLSEKMPVPIDMVIAQASRGLLDG